jgi:thiamine pyrophosphokinase
MNKIILFLNGEKPKNIPALVDYNLIVCTDGAYDYLTSINVVPDLIIGDFDSIEKLPTDINYIHTPDQNLTDFEKAINIIIEKGYINVDVYAANGLEQDHFLGNMTTALKYKKFISIIFYDDNQKYYFADKKTDLYQVKNKTISLFPFPETKNVMTTGLKYPLKGNSLSMLENKVGTRNYANDDVVIITFSSGNLLLFIER